MRKNYDESSLKDKILVLQKGWDESIPFTNWEEYLNCMKEPEVWASELELAALAMLIKCPIILINEERIPKILTLMLLIRMQCKIPFFFVQ